MLVSRGSSRENAGCNLRQGNPILERQVQVMQDTSKISANQGRLLSPGPAFFCTRTYLEVHVVHAVGDHGLRQGCLKCTW